MTEQYIPVSVLEGMRHERPDTAERYGYNLALTDLKAHAVPLEDLLVVDEEEAIRIVRESALYLCAMNYGYSSGYTMDNADEDIKELISTLASNIGRILKVKKQV